MKKNKNIENTITQIKNTLDILQQLNIFYFNIQPTYTNNIKENTQNISWGNHISGRSVSSKAFTNVNQYLNILSSNSYHGLMYDYSIIRCSFTFNNDKLISQNLLWWPCPVKIDNEFVEEFGLIDSIKMMLEDSNISTYIQMRSPVRFDFDYKNDSSIHPKAHVHLQHYNCRINTNKPICFNRFIKFILDNFYPDLVVDYRKWNFLKYNYNNSSQIIEYLNKNELLVQ